MATCNIDATSKVAPHKLHLASLKVKTIHTKCQSFHRIAVGAFEVLRIHRPGDEAAAIQKPAGAHQNRPPISAALRRHQCSSSKRCSSKRSRDTGYGHRVALKPNAQFIR